jgi:hypothetical protein
MIERVIAAFAGRPGIALDRRGSLRMLGTAALTATAARPAASRAAKGGKKTERRCDKRCRRQGETCQALVARSCADAQDAEECVALVTPCGAFLGRCQAGAFFDCLEGIFLAA